MQQPRVRVTMERAAGSLRRPLPSRAAGPGGCSDDQRQTAGGRLFAICAAILLAVALAGPVSAKPAEPFTRTTILDWNETTCTATVLYEWSGFTGKRLLAEIILFEVENGIDRPFAGADAFIVEGRQGSFEATIYSGFSSPEPARPMYATGELWTYNQNTRSVDGSRSQSDSLVTDCDF